METLSFAAAILPAAKFPECRCCLSRLFEIPPSLSSSSFTAIPNGRRSVRYSKKFVQTVPRAAYEGMTKKMKEMAAAQRRWEALVREGKVKTLKPKEAGYIVQLSDGVLLDVRPSTERKKAWVKGSKWVPIFDVDRRLDVGSLSNKVLNFAMGGWWSGIPLMTYNSQFIKQVESIFAKDTDLIVACQKGVRSLAACEQLYNAGFRNLYWVEAGFDSAEEEDFEREGPQPLKYAGIGGVSEFIGWTDQQRSSAAKEGLGGRVVYFARMVGVVVLADAIFVATKQLMEKAHEANL